ncbi:hypothetical protein [Xanthomonas floridensis]|uniref:Uncharacterized protein n=1 Tax=Xanthomonas floridensis TaxID=1843580 RepID=A0A1A9M7T0_9XANT|nr:hypothetical protein [Xanthomonas floridensis]MEA5123820.1 hypothetical protein [Xanthomonas floridensis]MEA5131499.1 hypothetical protein [Xanthomonas floridensis]OAG65697.1 hypothetical protein A7D17_08270 [Xanthomonas floridensis]
MKVKSLLESVGVALCGLVTSLLVAIADVAVARMTGFDFFTITIWVIVPVGGLITGFAAASGYYFGSLYFHKRATVILLIQMAAIAGLTQLLIYWLGYVTLILDDGSKVADLVPFGQYLNLMLTKAHYGGRAHTDSGEVGGLGYWIAGLQCVGFLVGGLAVFGFLKAKQVCTACNLYLRAMGKKRKVFANANAAGGYYDRLLTLAVNGPDFAALIRSDAKVPKIVQGVLRVDTSLLGCPGCKDQMIEERVSGYNGKEWKDLNTMHRQVIIPAGIDLAPVFRG